ncbi:MAG: hypothetical protein PHW13_04495 [Methylococcales bacterium]|nr:hypothetical protein [Methylococcales bacterium]
MIRYRILGLAMLTLGVIPVSAGAKTHSGGAVSAATRIAEEFAATVSGVTPTQINSNQAGSNPDRQLWRTGSEDVLSYQNWGDNTYTRNPGNVLQAAGVNLSGISVPSWIPALNQQQLYATAISPQHIISSAHWHPTVGQALYFVDAANHAVSRLVESAQQITDPNGGATDLWVGRLSSSLPESIRPFKVLPGNYRAMLPDIQIGIPAWVCQGGITTTSNLWTAAGVDDADGYQPRPSKGFDVRFTRQSAAYAGWNTVIHGGSGSPMFIVFNKQPVLISILHYMGGTAMLGGPSVADLAAQINAAMAALDGGAAEHRLSELKIE